MIRRRTNGENANDLSITIGVRHGVMGESGHRNRAVSLTSNELRDLKTCCNDGGTDPLILTNNYITR